MVSFYVVRNSVAAAMYIGLCRLALSVQLLCIMSDIRIFWTVVMPTAGPGIAAGTILTFARALGEYGATSMLAGNIPGKTATVSQRIAMVIQDGDYLTAGVWTAIVVLIAFIIVFLMNIISGKAMKSVKRW